MTTHQQNGSTKTYSSIQEATVAAAAAATASFGRPVTGILYSQAGRRFISSSLPVNMLLTMARRDSAGRKDNPGAHRNRPLAPAHVKEIAEYLRAEPQYLLPPIMLNAASPLQVFVFDAGAPTKPCIFVLPSEEYLYVTDGQHRIEALRQVIQEKPEMAVDSVGVTIVEEGDIDKVHQDFYDAAQAAQLSPSLLVEYDGREPLNAMTRYISGNASVLRGRVERIGNVGKNSLMLFSTNQVKQGIHQFLVGDWSLYASAIEKQAQQILMPAQELWRARIVNFLEEFTLHNPEWREVSNKPLESGLATDIPGMRQAYLHFSGGGLLVVGGVGHAILEGGNSDGTLSTDQKQTIEQFACLDWSRSSDLWRGYLVGPQGNITPHKNHIALAVAKVKKHLGLTLTEKDVKIIERSREAELEETPTTRPVAVV